MIFEARLGGLTIALGGGSDRKLLFFDRPLCCNPICNSIGSGQIINSHPSVIKRLREPLYIIAVDHPGEDGLLL